jgi:hypothetical protein
LIAFWTKNCSPPVANFKVELLLFFMQPLSVESHSVVRIPLPHIFVACKQAGVQDLSALDETVGDWRPVLLGAITTSTNSSKVVEWMVPAGKPAQFEVVARYTAIAALSGVLAVFVASVSKEHHY